MEQISPRLVDIESTIGMTMREYDRVKTSGKWIRIHSVIRNRRENNRLKSMTIASRSPASTQYAYAYDANGNMTLETTSRHLSGTMQTE